MSQSLILTDAQKVALAIQPKDASGEPATLDGAPTWLSSDETVVSVVAAPDGMTAEATTTGVLGAATVTVTGQGDLTGGGSDTISETIDITVEAGVASALNLSAGVPEAR